MRRDDKRSQTQPFTPSYVQKFPRTEPIPAEENWPARGKLCPGDNRR
jgi:hypothetical protein